MARKLDQAANAMQGFLGFVAEELVRAEAEHEPIHSFHEGYAVLLEELDEVWEECRKKTRDRDEAKALHELAQLAAMAMRCAQDMGLVARTDGGFTESRRG